MKNTAVSSPVRNSGTRSWWSATLSMQRRCCCSGAKSCPTICEPMDFSMPGFPVLHCLAEFAQVHVHWIGVLSNHLILWHPLLLLPSIFPNIRVFFTELALHIRWLNYWSFSFSFSPSNEYLGLISFRIYCFDFLAVQGTLKGLQHHILFTCSSADVHLDWSHCLAITNNAACVQVFVWTHVFNSPG